MKILLFIFSIYISIEILIFIFLPKFLKINEFDEGGVVVKDKSLGWRQKSNITFKYHHRYNKFISSVCKFNNFGTIDKINYTKKKKKKIRVALFGDTYFSAYDYGYKDSFQKIITDEISKSNPNIEIIFCFQRNYNTYQLFNFYKKFYSKFKIEHIIYIFNSNHPRRNITLHEATKSNKITYPYYNFKNLRKIKDFNVKHKDDLAYLDEKNKVIYKKNNNNFFNLLTDFAYNNLYIYSYISDQITGNNNLRKYKNISEIKKIEKQREINLENYPYQWKVTKKILLEWNKCLKKKNIKFHLVRNLINYQYDLNLKKHELSFQNNKLPEIYYLKDISKKIGINYLEYNRNELKKGLYYINPRYGYYNTNGINYFSKLLLKNIKNIILKYNNH